MIAPNIILPFDDDHANIPAGFGRETLLDGLYPKGTNSAGSTGGNSTHTHTSPAHSHTLDPHTHTGTSGAKTGGGFGSAASNTSGLADGNHFHTYSVSSSLSGGTTATTAVTYGSCSNHPPYYEVIFIKANKYLRIPVNALILSEATSRDDATFHAASAGKYLKGASAGQNAGGTGGSTTNTHDISHTHTTNTHSHAGGTTNSTNNAWEESPISGNQSLADHTHAFTVGASAQGINAISDSLVTAETVEPAFITLNAYKNDSEQMAQVGDIALWLGNTNSIPAGWALCDGTNGTPNMVDRFLKINASEGASATGGSHTHTHAAQSHSHTSNGTHSHTVAFGDHTGTRSSVGEGHATPSGTHTHISSTSTSTQASYAGANTTADSSNNEPPYRTVAYIQMIFQIGGGASVIPRFV